MRQKEANKWKVRYYENREELDKVARECGDVHDEVQRSEWARRRAEVGLSSLKCERDEEKANFSKVLDNKGHALAHAEAQSEEMKALLERRSAGLAHTMRALEDSETTLKTLLDERTAERAAFEGIASSADQIADVRVVEMVGELNYEIGQVASLLVFDDFPGAAPSTGEHVREALRVLEKRVGRGVSAILSQAGRGIEKDIAMQIAFQTCVSSRAHSIIERWYFGSLSDDDSVLHVLRDTPQSETENVTQEGHARSHKYARWTLEDQAKQEKSLALSISQLLGCVLVATGHALDKSVALSTVNEKAGAPVSEVVRLALALNEVFGQTDEMEVVHISHGKKFCEQYMEDGYSTAVSDEDTASQGLKAPRVLCTTDLGLLRVTNGVEDILVTPKVVLDTLIPRMI
ncbi:hypothetical protein OF83DRAFT_1088588 [Amylostereum chailletii]|nr:hypothetical protein OF83DRAFT_1088588 [Amylostereum chailletii]